VIRCAVPLSACLLIVAAAAHGATLRPMTELSSAIVLLRDLFDDAGPQAARALGPGPAPGQSITVPAPQLAAIAREFGVDWRPASPADRAILHRRGVSLPRETVLRVLRASLSEAGAEEGDLDVPDFDPPVVAPEARARPSIEQLDFDAPSGRFTAGVLIEGEAMESLHLRLSGRLVQTELVLVPTHRIAAGAPIADADLRPARVRSAALIGAVVRDAGEAEGLAPRHSLAAGVPIRVADLAAPLEVARGARVSVSLAAPGLLLASMGVALDSGAMGARIRILNPSSRAVLLAEVTGPDTVRVDPDSVPLRPGTDTGASVGAGLEALP
jgi:flagella basal body P-ring formation protein FlgA